MKALQLLLGNVVLSYGLGREQLERIRQQPDGHFPLSILHQPIAHFTLSRSAGNLPWKLDPGQALKANHSTMTFSPCVEGPCCLSHADQQPRQRHGALLSWSEVKFVNMPQVSSSCPKSIKLLAQVQPCT